MDAQTRIKQCELSNVFSKYTAMSFDFRPVAGAQQTNPIESNATLAALFYNAHSSYRPCRDQPSSLLHIAKKYSRYRTCTIATIR